MVLKKMLLNVSMILGIMYGIIILIMILQNFLSKIGFFLFLDAELKIK